MVPKRTPARVVVVGSGDAIVGQALELLLRGAHYSVRFLAEPPLEPGLLDDAELLLLAPGLNAERRESTLGLFSGHSTAKIPILELITDSEDAPALGCFVPWPCRAEDLQRHIEAALYPELTVDECGQALQAPEGERTINDESAD